MTIETFDVLEEKVQHVIQSMQALHTEANELRKNNSAYIEQNQALHAKNQQLEAHIQALHDKYASLGEENQRLKSEFKIWQERLRQLLTKINDI